MTYSLKCSVVLILRFFLIVAALAMQKMDVQPIHL